MMGGKSGFDGDEARVYVDWMVGPLSPFLRILPTNERKEGHIQSRAYDFVHHFPCKLKGALGGKRSANSS